MNKGKRQYVKHDEFFGNNYDEMSFICPSCGERFTGFPAFSRYMKNTYVCSDCGMREGFEAMGCSEEKAKKYVKAINKALDKLHSLPPDSKEVVPIIVEDDDD